MKHSPRPNYDRMPAISVINTSELPFAAYLRARYRAPLLDIKRCGNKVTWSYEVKEMDEATLISEFHRGGVVAATEYYSELKNLKSMTYV